MSSPPTQPDQPHLVSLVLQSKKALQHGEQLCSRAHAVSNASAQSAIDVVAIDAKVRWVTDAVAEQLKLVTSVSKSIEEKRSHLEKQVQSWDVLRVKHSDALETILESIGSQLVPSDFHESTSADSSLFGSQHSEDESHPKETAKVNGRTMSISHSPSSTIRTGLRKGKQKQKSDPQAERKWWKNLRDFVDDQAIEDLLETIENDRLGLDDIMSKTDQYPETLLTTTVSIRDSLPEVSELPVTAVEDILATQDAMSTVMAAHLESLASHYDQMATALRDSEAGEAFNEDDLQDMNRDTDELPLIMAELEESADAIETQHEKLRTHQEVSQGHLSLLMHVLDDLDELGEIMSEMLQMQEDVEVKCKEELDGLHNHLLTLEHLRDRFVSYQLAFNKLILELARRRQYREEAEDIVHGMMAKLEAMTEEEKQLRNHFNLEYGAHLPEDICLCVGNAPTKWEVVPWSGDALEFFPALEDDIITQAKDRIRTSAEQDGHTIAVGIEDIRDHSPHVSM
ncbi:autophagy protein Apg17-domain-containing protein [Collybia nuda]|uniref:Autophagy-related protein 17 n=1 Tax=Collybia nuda TaxID=64659 RepID=A0A9P5YAG0_9AGAR|nr:autophagy protein Apg17-domain-containing protein [Collybia nuda]